MSGTKTSVLQSLLRDTYRNEDCTSGELKRVSEFLHVFLAMAT